MSGLEFMVTWWISIPDKATVYIVWPQRGLCGFLLEDD